MNPQPTPTESRMHDLARGPAQARIGANNSGSNVAENPSSVPCTKGMSQFQNETCPRCIEERRRADTILVDLQNTQTDLVAKNREIGRLKGMIVRQDDDSPENAQVRELLVLWRDEIRGEQRGPKPNIAADSTRAVRVRWAIKTYGVDRTRQAILGCKFDDWAMGRLRKTNGQAFNDVAKHILRDVETFEKFEGLYIQNTRPTLDAPQLRLVPKPGPVARRLVRIEQGSAPPIDKALQGIQNAGCEWRASGSPDIWRAQCPSHQGDGFSLKLTRSDDGMLLVHCNVGCSFEDVVHAMGMEPRDCWENSELDHQAMDYRSAGERAADLPPHLKQAMRQLLARSERQAA